MTPATVDFVVGTAIVLTITGSLLSVIFNFFGNKSQGAEKRIYNLLPGMNCGQCGYPGCEAYARALVKGEAAFTLCPPGGPDLTQALSEALGLQAGRGEDYDDLLFSPRLVAEIHPQNCNGCGKCARACNADAITGVAKQPYTVNKDFCIGCADCVNKCPHECIEMIRTPNETAHFNWNIKSVYVSQERR